MATWQDDTSMYGSKQDVWDAIIAEQPMLEQSAVFQEGFDKWDMGGGIGQFIHNNFFAPPLDLANRAFTGDTLGGSATPWGTIRLQPDEPSEGEDWASLMGHEIGHLGWKYKNRGRGLWNDLIGSEFPGLGGGEEWLNRMHDYMYQPSGYSGKGGKNRLQEKGYIERIPGGPGYAGGTQYSPSGSEFIRKSGIIPEHQKVLGYYESPNQTTRYESQGPYNRHTDPVVPRTTTFSDQTFDRPPSMYQQMPPQRGVGPSRAQQRLNTGGLASLWQT